jgi:hypothetical protein
MAFTPSAHGDGKNQLYAGNCSLPKVVQSPRRLCNGKIKRRIKKEYKALHSTKIAFNYLVAPEISVTR